MKLLSLQINNAFESVLDFDATRPRLRSYIIEGGLGGEVSLLTLPIDNRARRSYTMLPALCIQTERAEDHVYMYKIEDEEVTDDSLKVTDYKTCIHFHLYGIKKQGGRGAELKREEAAVVRLAQESKFRFTSLDNSVSRELIQGKTYEFVLVFHLRMLPEDKDAKDLLCSVRLLVAPQEMVENVSLDFGSEASQLMVYNRGIAELGTPRILDDVFSRFKKELVPAMQSGTQDSDFQQYDPDPRLFRSCFYGKSVIPFDRVDPVSRPSRNGNMLFLTKHTDRLDGYFSLPNVKIANLGAGVVSPKVQYKGSSEDSSEFENGYFYRCAFNSFIYHALDKVVKDAETKGHRMLVRLYVLMPNVYGQKELARHLRFISDDVDRILMRPPYSEWIIGVEINSVSESDASLLGTAFTHEHKSLPSGRYLIMDAGKGTLDFSVLDYDSNATGVPPYTCVYRSGIVGAGNALSYAIFLDMLKAVISSYLSSGEDVEVEMEKWISTYLKTGDEAYWSMLMSLVDCYKARYEELKTGSAGDADKKDYSISDIDLQTFVQLVKKNFIDEHTTAVKLPSEDYLEAMIENLVDDVIEKMGYRGNLDYVVLAGRGFLFKPFRNAVLTAIRSCKDWEGIEEFFPDISGNTYTVKNVCLFASEMIALGRYDGKRVGRPIMVSGDSADFSKGGKKTLFGKLNLLQRFLEWRRRWENGAFDGYVSDDMRRMDYLDFVHGISLPYTGHGDRVCISGAYYYLPASVKKGEIIVLFNGENFIYRYRKGTADFTPAPASEYRFLFESTFPHGKGVRNASRIPFPKHRQH